MIAVWFALAAAAGSVTRGLVGQFANEPKGIAYGTLIVNVTGSFALGALQSAGGATLTVLGTGFLGAFTTFSSFSRDVLALAELRKTLLAVAYLVGTLACCVGAAALGVWIS